MIVDCHTQIWTSAHQLGRDAPPVTTIVHADEQRHLSASDPVDKAIVLAFKSRYLGAEIPNRFVAEYVRRHPGKLIGFAGIDPLDRDWLEELRMARDDLNLKGVVVSPSLQNFHPCDTRAMRLYEQCARLQLPVLFEQHQRNPHAKMEYARPALLDEVAREFAELRIVISRLGEPWVDETMVLLAKHAGIYADVAGLLPQPFRSYTALLTAHEYGVLDKVLFGSDFPYRAPAACIEALYTINQFSHGSSLPAIPREHLRGIVERNALDLLGIGSPPAQQRQRSAIFTEDE